MRSVVEGKYDLETMGKVLLDIVKDYTPENAVKVIVETIRFVFKANS